MTPESIEQFARQWTEWIDGTFDSVDSDWSKVGTPVEQARQIKLNQSGYVVDVWIEIPGQIDVTIFNERVTDYTGLPLTVRFTRIDRTGDEFGEWIDTCGQRQRRGWFQWIDQSCRDNTVLIDPQVILQVTLILSVWQCMRGESTHSNQ